MKSITFLLPSGCGHPGGGVKVVFEYANRFVTDGYDVHIMMPASLVWSDRPLREKIKSILRYPYHLITKKHLPYDWFKLDRKVKVHLTWSLHQCFAPKTDVYIATAIETSEYLNSYRGICDHNKYYFIQGYESWHWGEERFLNSLRQSLRKIVISPFLQKVVERENQSAVLIENGFDFKYFHTEIPVKDKDRFSVTMLYHVLELKGCDDGFVALEIVRQKYPIVKLCLFGYPPSPVNLPKWVEYHQKPDKKTHNTIYNKSAIFLGTSHFEGWGLTIGEAMMCGAAIVCTDNEGYTEMVKDGFTGLVSPIKTPQGLADNIIRLIEDDELRCKLAQNGSMYIKQFTWERAYSKFKTEIEK